MNRSRLVFLSVALILAVAATGRADDIDDVVNRWIQQQHVPAASIAVIKDGFLIKAQGYGLANIEHGIPARPDTVFKIGSVSKQFIATGIMLLVQDGRISVDDRVSKFIPGTPATWQVITLRHLLTHTSGLIREAPGFDPRKLQPDMDVIKTAYPLPLNFKPGDKYEYSNLGYFVLGEVIHRVSEKPWADFLTERVFTPLGMTSTRTTTLPDIVPNRAAGYAWETDKYLNAEEWWAVRPSGAFLSTALDLAKWEDALVTERILKTSSKTQMWTRVKLNDGRTHPYGFGWELADWPGDSTGSPVPTIQHGGTMNGFRATFSRFPSYGLTVIALTNRTGTPVEGLAANIAITVVPQLRSPAAR